MPRKTNGLLDSFGTLSPRVPSARERLAGLLSGVLGQDNRQGYQSLLGLLGQSSSATPESKLMEMSNPAGGLFGAYDAGQEIGRGNYLAGGTGLAMAFLPGPKVKRFPAYKGMNAYVIEGTHPNYVERGLVDLTKGRGQHEWSGENSPKNAGFFSSSPDVASHFAEALSPGGAAGHSVGGGAVFPVDVSFNNPLIIDGEGRHAADFQFGKNADLWKQYFNSPEFDQYDGVILKNVKDAGGVTDIYVPKDPEQIAHKFDPKK